MSEAGEIEITFVVPCYNEEANVRAMRDALTFEAERHAKSHEIIFIDNHSTDRTRPLLRELCAEDTRVRAIFNNRNYGQMRSPTYCVYQGEGRAVIGLCCDFQDPPALIGPMIAHWRDGAEIVLGKRRSEKSSLLLRSMRAIGYGFFQRFADYPVIPGVTGFGLYDRRPIDAIAAWNEPEPFLRGMLVESGYRLVVLPYDRPPRAGGETKNNFGSLWSFALSGIAGSTKSLLRMPLSIALFGVLFTGALLLLALVMEFVGGPALAVAALGLALGLFSVVMFFMGLMGDQIRLISERTRNVPLVIEDERVNFPPDRAFPSHRTAVVAPH